MVVNKGLFTNACKKVLKYVHIASQKTLKIEVLEEALKDTFVKIVKHLLAQKEDQSNFKVVSLKNTFYSDRLSSNYQRNIKDHYLGYDIKLMSLMLKKKYIDQEQLI